MDKNPLEPNLSLSLIVGLKNSCKTAFLDFLIQKAYQNKLHVAGFLSRGKLCDGQKNQYFLEDIRTGKHYLLANQTPGRSENIPYGVYFFDPDIFELGNELLLHNLNADLLVLDEFGSLELKGQGFRRAFDIILREYHGIFLIAVRPVVLPELKKILISTKEQRSFWAFLKFKISEEKFPSIVYCCTKKVENSLDKISNTGTNCQIVAI